VIVYLHRLRIDNLRVIEHLELDLAPHWNLFIGANGAGKTSILEAAFLLSHARSFRTTAREALVRSGTRSYSIFGECIDAAGATVRAGLARSAAGLEARLDGEVVAAGDFLRRVAVVCFEPGSHALISGTSEERRRLLDWGVFHVEHDYLAAWRRFQRALKQRNALLRSGLSESDLDSWDHELAEAAAPVSAARRAYFVDFATTVEQILGELLPELGQATLAFDEGHDNDMALADQLRMNRGRDLARGYTSRGPHRADWNIHFVGAPRRDHLSRGQEKLCAFACVLAQARLFELRAGEWPILCVDDLASEMDRVHQDRILDAIAATPAQVLATGTFEPDGLAARIPNPARFHVEQGTATRLL
jgi:DNA replication and repair protein RecF